MQYKSIKEIVDYFCPDMKYFPASKGNLRLKCPFCGGKKAYINEEVNGFICHSGSCGKQFEFMSLYHELSGNPWETYRDIVALLDGHISRCKPYDNMLPKLQ